MKYNKNLFEKILTTFNQTGMAITLIDKKSTKTFCAWFSKNEAQKENILN